MFSQEGYVGVIAGNSSAGVYLSRGEEGRGSARHGNAQLIACVCVLGVEVGRVWGSLT